MTVAHQYSTLKDEKLHTISYTVQTVFTRHSGFRIISQ